MGAVKQTVWDWRAAGNFAGGGTGSGLAVCTAAIALFVQPPTGRIASLIAAIAVALGLALVAHEMGRPLRFFRVFFHAGTSWMSREALIAPLLLATLAAAAYSGSRELTIAAGIFGAALLFVQTQMLAAARGIAAWSLPKIVPMLFVTGLAEGAGVYLCVNVSTGVPAVALYLILLLLLRDEYWRAYLVKLRDANARACAELERFDLPIKIVGTMVPVALLTLGFVLPAMAPVFGAVAGIMALITGWELRYRIVTRAGFTHGFAVPGFPT